MSTRLLFENLGLQQNYEDLKNVREFMRAHCKRIRDHSTSECPICFESYGPDGEIAMQIDDFPGCNHVIGLACLTRILAVDPLEEKKCPFCRTIWIPATAAAPSRSRPLPIRIANVDRNNIGAALSVGYPRAARARNPNTSLFGRMTRSIRGAGAGHGRNEPDDEVTVESYRQFVEDIANVRRRAARSALTRAQRYEDQRYDYHAGAAQTANRVVPHQTSVLEANNTNAGDSSNRVEHSGLFNAGPRAVIPNDFNPPDSPHQNPSMTMIHPDSMRRFSSERGESSSVTTTGDANNAREPEAASPFNHRSQLRQHPDPPAALDPRILDQRAEEALITHRQEELARRQQHLRQISQLIRRQELELQDMIMRHQEELRNIS